MIRCSNLCTNTLLKCSHNNHSHSLTDILRLVSFSDDMFARHLILRGQLLSGKHTSASRQLNSLRMASTTPLEGNAFEIPVPWGMMGGKEWGQPDGHPWIVLHGWLDNCGSFDTLAPLFPPGHRLLCLDMPGHGLSSHGPPGLGYHYMDGLQQIRRVAKHFGLGKFSLMGHSMGGGISTLFSSTHPDMVQSLILLDVIKPISRSITSVVDRTRSSVDELLAFEEKLALDEAPMYTYDEAQSRLIRGSAQLHGQQVITEESAGILLRRGLKKTVIDADGKQLFTYTRDLRHRVTGLYGLSHEAILEFLSKITCPTLLIKARDARYYEKKDLAVEALEVYRKNPDFTFVEVDGTHHVHLNQPEVVMEHIASEGKYSWTSDLRLRIGSPVSLVVEQVEQMASDIDCPHLLIKASDSPLYMSEEIAERIIKIYTNNNPDFEYRSVQGGHHVHMNEPEKR
eukprot:maker-scaffold18_size714446-snap-gene-4.12 protein:Tk08474 transcript:maker-scaffold18_size714446-snap-gene-4.12-mRNA-1 annotation:"probable serine hydrolase"